MEECLKITTSFSTRNEHHYSGVTCMQTSSLARNFNSIRKFSSSLQHFHTVIHSPDITIRYIELKYETNIKERQMIFFFLVICDSQNLL